MKKRVNISKLIEEKYADKDDTFSFKQLNEMIDSLLDEAGFSYETKNTDPANLEENPLQGQNVSYHANGAGGPRNPVSDADKDFISAEKIAEATPTAISTQVKLDVQVPDLYNLITNSKMELGSDDRQLVNNIIENIGINATSWKQRVIQIQQFAQKLGTISPAGSDIRQAISSLVYLQLLRKLAYFTENGGKSFEYVFAPLIAPDAIVVGGKGDITDVQSPTKGGFSLKFLTSDYPDVVGSRENLKNIGSIPYIVARARGGRIEFTEITITANKQDVAGHFLIKDLIEGSYLKNTVGGTGKSEYTLYVKENRNEDIKSLLLPTPQDYREKKPTPTVKRKEQDPTLTISGATDKLSEFQKLINFLNSRLKDKEINNEYIELIKRELPDYKEVDLKLIDPAQFKKMSTSEVISSKRQNQEKKYNFLNNVLSNLQSEIKSELENLNVSSSPQPTNEARQVSTSQPKVDNRPVGKFFIPLQSVWEELKLPQFTLELGTQDVYNKQMLEIGDSIQKVFVSTLKELQSLNNNITNYFATSAQKQAQSNKNYAQDSINNAENIVRGITEIAKSEGTSVINKLKR